MTIIAATEHFAGPPEWTWYILFYFFLAGVAGGSYFLATLLRYWGAPADEAVARIGFYVAFPATLLGLLLLTLDLKQPLRFWHMLFNTTPGQFGLNFNSSTPMSVGVWALLVASVFAAVSFLDALARDRRSRALLDGAVGMAWSVVGSVVYLFIAGYTGVLLAVSNQPIWSDSWALGGLFLASGLSGAAALLLLLSRYRSGAESTRGMLELSERLFTVLELVLLVIVLLTLIDDGTLGKALSFPWVLLWLAALVGMLPALAGLTARRFRVGSGGTLAAGRVQALVLGPTLVLLGVLALRAWVIFAAQH
ncbi:MAG: polysulfide reductase NrfD [Thermoleophilia bacterium]|nr:polysulfide reductase NrfD [Thermoleophilia bacterium]